MQLSSGVSERHRSLRLLRVSSAAYRFTLFDATSDDVRTQTSHVPPRLAGLVLRPRYSGCRLATMAQTRPASVFAAKGPNVERSFHGEQIIAGLCDHLRPAVAWLRDAHGLSPRRAVLDIKANSLSVEYDAHIWHLTPAGLAAALGPTSTLDIHAGGFTCRDCWQSASAVVPRDA